MRITGTVQMAAGLALALAAHSAQVQFEVASVKPGDANARGNSANFPAGRMVLRNYPLKGLIEMAYEINDSELIGEPKGFDKEGYDIDATVPRGASDDQRMEMLQALLVDRFKLAFHRETRSLQAYVLTVAKGGAKLSPATGQGTSYGPRMIKGKSIDLPELAEMLTKVLGRPVFDETGIKGSYDVSLDFAPVQASPDGDAESGPSIFAAIQEQLGLKLEATKRPVEVMVIDHVEKPSGN